MKEELIIQLILCFGTLLFLIGIFIRFIWGTDKACFISTKLLVYGTSTIMVGVVGCFFGSSIMIICLFILILVIGLKKITER